MGAFRGASDKEDWETFNSRSTESLSPQDDGANFVRGWFDESFCLFLQYGLHESLVEALKGADRFVATGSNLGAAWASILANRVSAGAVLCPLGLKFFLEEPQGGLLAVTFGSPGVFYNPPPVSLGLQRQVDYVYHLDTFARLSHEPLTDIGVHLGFCPMCGKMENSPDLISAPCPPVDPRTHNGSRCDYRMFRFGNTQYFASHYHGDMTTVWILNKPHAPAEPPYQKASRSSIQVFTSAAERDLEIRVNGEYPWDYLDALKKGTKEHLEAYRTVPWIYEPVRDAGVGRRHEGPPPPHSRAESEELLV